MEKIFIFILYAFTALLFLLGGWAVITGTIGPHGEFWGKISFAGICFFMAREVAMFTSEQKKAQKPELPKEK